MTSQDNTPARSYEYAVLHWETLNEVARYDSKAAAYDAVRWYEETYGRELRVREVEAGSGEVCLGIGAVPRDC